MNVLKLCFFFSIAIINLSCSTARNYAPVKDYQRDLVNGSKYYQVKRGDTLYSIGFRSGHGYRLLAKWNKLTSPYRLLIGQKIKLFIPKNKVRKIITIKSPRGKRTRSRIGYESSAKKRTSSQISVTSSAKKRTSSQKNPENSYINKKLLKLYWQWPIKGKILKYFSKTGNTGLDIFGRLGGKVKSSASGKVVYSGNGLKGYGNLLIIKHNELYLSAYANNSRLFVKEGQLVKKGQVIAEIGRVGSNQASLHFEIRKNGKPVNPLNYLPKM